MSASPSGLTVVHRPVSTTRIAIVAVAVLVALGVGALIGRATAPEPAGAPARSVSVISTRWLDGPRGSVGYRVMKAMNALELG